MTRLLIDAGANPNPAKGGLRFHLLHIAVGKLETVGALNILLESGADPNATDDLRRTALGLATHGVTDGRRPSRQRYPHTEAINLLLQHGASLTLSDSLGDIPITVLARKGRLSLFQSCLEKIAEPWPRAVHGEILLHAAAAAGSQIEVVEYLLSRGTDVNEMSRTGWTATGFAASCGMSRLLIRNDAHVKMATDSGWTALYHVADVSKNYEEAAELTEILNSHGANIEARAVVPGWDFGSKERPTMTGYRVIQKSIAEQSDAGPERTHQRSDASTLGGGRRAHWYGQGSARKRSEPTCKGQ